MLLRLFLIGVLVLGLGGCSPSSLEDYRKEGESLSASLIKQLEGIETREDLLQAGPVLKKYFEAYVDLIIQARAYQKKHEDETRSELAEDDTISEQLKEQLRRIYAIEGGREIIEKAQQEALVRLDGFEF